MSDLHDKDAPSTRLTSLLPSTGGGLQPKRKRDGDEPRNEGSNNGSSGKSLLGLDRLAARKREEQNQFQKPVKEQPKRSYRRSDTETPSHPGGVNRDAYHRVRQQEQRRQQRGQRQHQPYNSRYGDDHDSDRRRDDRDHRYGSRDGRYDRDNRHDNRPRRDDEDRGSSKSSSRYRSDYRDSSRDTHQLRDKGSSSRYSTSQQRNDNDRSRMPPPSEVTPSTNATAASSMRSSNLRYKHEALSRLDAATPMSRNAATHRSMARTPASTRSGWDETPLPSQRDDDNIPQPDDEDFDRHFYLDQEEGGYVLDNTDQGDMGRFLFENSKTKAREEDMERKRMNRYNPRKAALQDDQDAWEENRLLSSGAAVLSSVDLDVSTEKDERVTLLVHQVKPPFLDGRVSFSTIREAVPTVKDASSDFAKMAREGSATLRHLRATKEKHTMRQKFWELGGTRMGDAVGVKKTEGEEGDGSSDQNKDQQDTNADGEIDYKKSSGFAQHMKNSKKDGPVSAFAKSKTIRQQREYLPVFSVRDELLNVIRENTCVVIVGETGSGKVRCNTHASGCISLFSHYFLTYNFISRCSSS